MNIVLSANDERIGTYNTDGSFDKWPAVDVFGGQYERLHITVHRISSGTFVVVPADREKDIETLTMEKSLQPQTVPVSQQLKRKGDEVANG